MKKKINSFTLSEITVTLIIVLIVVILSYQILRNMQSDFGMFQKNETSSGKILQSYFRIKNDFEKSSIITKEENYLKMITQKQDTILYFASDSLFVRQIKNSSDTINFYIRNYTFHSFETSNEHNLVTSIEISFSKYPDDKIILRKLYTPENIINFFIEIR